MICGFRIQKDAVKQLPISWLNTEQKIQQGLTRQCSRRLPSSNHRFELQKHRQLFIRRHNETLPVISRNSGYRHMPRPAEKCGIAVLPGWLAWSRSQIPWIPRN